MEKTCSKCGGKMVYKEGTFKSGKKVGQKYQKWECTTPTCKDGDYPTTEWIKVPLVQAQEAQAKRVTEEKVDWDGKEKRMVRMNSMSHATELVNHLFETGEEDRLKKLFEYAEKIEKWIYRQ